MRQVRRLQSFARLVRSPKPELAVVLVENWSAIVRAKGFSPSFDVWWSHCDFKTADAPAECPSAPPVPAVVDAMFNSLMMAVRHFETQLRNQTRQYAKFRRDQNPNLVFADTRPSKVPGVDVLLQPIRAKVEDVDATLGQVMLDGPVDFMPSQPVSCDGQVLQVIHHEADALWIANPEAVQVGGVVQQTKFVGHLDALEHEFLEVWRERWMRHVDVPPERWEVIVQFAQQNLPRGTFHWPSMQPVDFKTILRSKKKSTSAGFDGVTLKDLKSMPDSAL